ncbi:hypothetical protein [Massilia sp. HP4]|uniref:hypothetical protein n=1 Tax=Massilia sp. HP4 TaxID=2562316 RepID=UPI0010BFC894|nr:hypothetical protein [Massilia sp. HP4]
MKSVTFSEIVRIRERPGFLRRTDTWRQSLPWALTLLGGLPLLVLVLHLIDPDAPLPYVVLPAIVGGLLPVFMLGPGRFEMRTRFDAHYMISTLDETLGTLGYRRLAVDSTSIRYFRPRPWLRRQEGAINVAVREHVLEIVGPVGSLRLLQHRIAR